MTDHHSNGTELHLSLELDFASDVPVYRQIVDRIWLGVIEDEFTSGTRLPTVRQLSVQLGVSPRSVERAYEDLETRGVISTRQGSGTFVCLKEADNAEIHRRDQLEQLCREVSARAQDLDISLDEIVNTLREMGSRPGGQQIREE